MGVGCLLKTPELFDSTPNGRADRWETGGGMWVQIPPVNQVRRSTSNLLKYLTRQNRRVIMKAQNKKGREKMALTIGNWILIAILVIIGLVSIGYGLYKQDGVAPYVVGGIVIVLAVVLIFVFNWYHKNTASGVRNYKDFTSEMSNGIDREITITAEDGREIFHYEGKVDIETKHEGNGNYICFETQDGKRYLIYYGIQDTLLIIEK